MTTEAAGDHDHPNQDLDAKHYLSAFQADFLRDVEAAVNAGLPPADDDPVYETDQAAIDAAWAEAGQ